MRQADGPECYMKRNGATVHHSTGYTSSYAALLDSESTGAGV